MILKNTTLPPVSSEYVESFFANHSKMDSLPESSSVISSLNDGEKELISYYIVGVSMISVCCFGLVGNILSLIVLTRRAIGASTTNIYLISLVITDIFVLIATILTAIKDSRKPVVGRVSWLVWQDAPIVPRAYPFCHATAILFQVTSVWLTVAFAADRYLMICHPFWAKRWCTMKLAKIIIILIYIFSVIYGIPRYFEYKIFEMQLPLNPAFLEMKYDDFEYNGIFVQNLSSFPSVTSDNGFNEDGIINDSMTSISIIWYQLTDFGESDQFRKAYHLWSWVLLVVGIPFILIAIMNTFLIIEVRKSSRKCVDQTKRSEYRRQDTNIMLIGVIIIFFICQLPAAVSHIAWGLITMDSSKNMSWFLLNEIGNLLIVVNSAINLLPYYIFSRRFRRHFVRTFWPYRCIRDNGLHCIYIPEWATRSLNNNDDGEDSDIAATATQYSHNPRMNSRIYSNYRLSIYRNNSSSSRSRPSLPSNMASSCESKKLFSNIFKPIFRIRRKQTNNSCLSCELKTILPVDKGLLSRRALSNDYKLADEMKACNHNLSENINNPNSNSNNIKSSKLYTLPYRGSNSSRSSVSFLVRADKHQTVQRLKAMQKKKSISDFRFDKTKQFIHKSDTNSMSEIYANTTISTDTTDNNITEDKVNNVINKSSHNNNNMNNFIKTPTIHLQSLEELSSNLDVDT
ncbi:FMRFamide receptor isoform 1 [Schistosoma japonicum]|uniref:FMRFamide receptor isoform 1 n=2 Tax=Schistosoma japonicum TaxID=6182 RepID=A0A4Z2DWN7_SCHJA|nr:FMRFamide receptor isoform 1 [Schistosoma japonicum]